MSEAQGKLVTREELEEKLWELFQDAQRARARGVAVDVARLLHESISAREAKSNS